MFGSFVGVFRSTCHKTRVDHAVKPLRIGPHHKPLRPSLHTSRQGAATRYRVTLPTAPMAEARNPTYRSGLIDQHCSSDGEPTLAGNPPLPLLPLSTSTFRSDRYRIFPRRLLTGPLRRRSISTTSSITSSRPLHFRQHQGRLPQVGVGTLRSDYHRWVLVRAFPLERDHWSEALYSGADAALPPPLLTPLANTCPPPSSDHPPRPPRPLQIILLGQTSLLCLPLPLR